LLTIEVNELSKVTYFTLTNALCHPFGQKRKTKTTDPECKNNTSCSTIINCAMQVYCSYCYFRSSL